MNEGESTRKLPKTFAGKKTYEWQKNSFTRWFNQKLVWRDVLKVDACAAAKHKTILSWPHLFYF